MTALTAHVDIVLEVDSEQANFKDISVAEELDFGSDIAALPGGTLLLSEYSCELLILIVPSSALNFRAERFALALFVQVGSWRIPLTA